MTLDCSMGLDRDVNTYYYPEYQKVESGAWQFQNYDTNGVAHSPPLSSPPHPSLTAQRGEDQWCCERIGDVEETGALHCSPPHLGDTGPLSRSMSLSQ